MIRLLAPTEGGFAGHSRMRVIERRELVELLRGLRG